MGLDGTKDEKMRRAASPPPKKAKISPRRGLALAADQKGPDMKSAGTVSTSDVVLNMLACWQSVKKKKNCRRVDSGALLLAIHRLRLYDVGGSRYCGATVPVAWLCCVVPSAPGCNVCTSAAQRTIVNPTTANPNTGPRFA